MDFIKRWNHLCLNGLISLIFLLLFIILSNKASDIGNFSRPSTSCLDNLDLKFENKTLFSIVTSLQCMLTPYCSDHVMNLVTNMHGVNRTLYDVKINTDHDDEHRVQLYFSDASFPIELPLFSNHCSDSVSMSYIDKATVKINVMVSLLIYSEWEEIVFLYDSEYLSLALALTDTLTQQGIYISLYNINNYNESGLTSLLNSLNSDLIGGALNISLICDIPKVISVLNSAHDFHNKYVHGQMRIQHISKWIIFSTSDFEQTDLQTLNLDNIVFVNLNINEQILQQVPTCQNLTTEMLFSVQTLLWQGSNKREFSEVGQISMRGDISCTSKLFPNTDYGFNGRMLRTTTLQWGGMTILDEDGNFTGLCFDVLEEIARRLNFTYEVMETEDKAFGLELPNGTWTGMVGKIQNEQADLVAASLTINPERERVLDFTYPLLFDHMTVIYAKPDVNKWRTLIDPFQTMVIVLILATLTLVSFLYCLLERWHPQNADKPKKYPTNFIHSFWYMYGAMLAQGGDTLPTTLAGRTIISCWWIFCIVSIAVYSGNLTAAFTVNKQTLPFTTVDEMVKQKEYKWGLLGNSVYETVFKESNVPTYVEVWNGIVGFNHTDPSVLSSDGRAHLKKVIAGNYALIMGKQFIDYEAADNCNLIVLDEKIAPNQVAFAMANNSPFIRIVSDEILSLHETGLIEKWRAERWPQKMCDVEAFNARKISLEDVQSAFYIIAIGVVLATFFLIIERIIWKFKLVLSSKEDISKATEKHTNGIRLNNYKI